MTLSPVVLFVYNRPEHTLKTLQALCRNKLAKQSKLFVFADGPKPDASAEDLKKIKAVRKILRKDQWCNEVEIIEQKQNKGLADSIVSGVTKVINIYGKVIVLEDDIYTSPGFLQYMNDALTIYEDEEKVMHISAFFPPIKRAYTLPETFFYEQASCWGWATWKRAWQFYNPNARLLLESIIRQGRVKEFNLDGSFKFTHHLEQNIHGEINTWAIKWYASIFLQRGVALHPNISLVRNIGTDGTGEHHISVNKKYLEQTIADQVEVNKKPVKVSHKAIKLLKQFHAPSKPSLKVRIKRKIKSAIQRFII